MRLPVIITAAGPAHRSLLVQALVSPGNRQLPMARFLLDLVADSAQRVALVVSPESGRLVQPVVEGLTGPPVTIIEQAEPLGYAHALYQARDFAAGEPVLHLVGDHFYLADSPDPPQMLVRRMIEIFETERASVSAVQPTRENAIGSFGSVAGPMAGFSGTVPLYQVETVLEKPTPTEAEQVLVSPGLRAGHYLCFFGIHIFTPTMMRVLDEEYFGQGRQPASLSEVMQVMARRERYLAAALPGRRFDLGSQYGLLQAQLALSLQSPDREAVLAMLVEILAR